MKEYSAYFSYYSEQNGSFEEITVKVEAVSLFEARRTAWERLDDNDDIKFASCVKLCGITWGASKLDMQDYFNAEAAYDKYKLKYIDNVEIPNAEMQGNKESLGYYGQQKSEHYGSLNTISHIAEDLGKPYGMLPPAFYEELHYTREFLNLIDSNDYDKYSALLKQIERAEKWDYSALYGIREMLQNGYGTADGHHFNFSAQFGKDGVYPVHADRTDFASTYISRWTNAREYKRMASLPFFGEKDIVANSQTMQYDWQMLVIKKEALPSEMQTPENSLWIANQGSAGNFDKDGDRSIVAENPVTGEIAEWKRTDFFGVLRPEKNAKIDFEAVKSEYQAKSAEKSRVTQANKPSILKTVEDNKRKIAQAVKTAGLNKYGKSHIVIDD